MIIACRGSLLGTMHKPNASLGNAVLQDLVLEPRRGLSQRLWGRFLAALGRRDDGHHLAHHGALPAPVEAVAKAHGEMRLSGETEAPVQTSAMSPPQQSGSRFPP